MISAKGLGVLKVLDELPVPLPPFVSHSLNAEEALDRRGQSQQSRSVAVRC